ncbi:hypothetical protein V866_002848 [Kwoniella sp. B9012]
MAEHALPLDPYSSDDDQEEDAAEVARQERRVERENLISGYGGLTSSQRDVVRDPSASVGSAILAFSRDPPSFSRDWEEDSIWGIVDYDQLITALQYKGLPTQTRDSLLAAPIQSFLDERWRTKYALDCKSFLRFYSRGCSQSPPQSFWLPRRESMNLDLNDSKLAKETLGTQLASSPSGGTELSEEGKELYALHVVSIISRKLFEHFNTSSYTHRIGILPKDIPDSILEIIPHKTREHAEDNWRLISDAYSPHLTPSFRSEALQLETENRTRLFSDWNSWRERGSRERWLSRQIEEGKWEHIAPW